MDNFLKITATVLITVVLYLILSKQNKDLSMLILIAGCCLVMLVTMRYLDPVISFLNKLKITGQLDDELIHVLMKAVGIGIVAEITGMICSDAGNASLGKALQILSSAVILWISIPIFERMLELIDRILGSL